MSIAIDLIKDKYEKAGFGVVFETFTACVLHLTLFLYRGYLLSGLRTHKETYVNYASNLSVFNMW